MSDEWENCDTVGIVTLQGIVGSSDAGQCGKQGARPHVVMRVDVPTDFGRNLIIASTFSSLPFRHHSKWLPLCLLYFEYSRCFSTL